MQVLLSKHGEGKERANAFDESSNDETEDLRCQGRRKRRKGGGEREKESEEEEDTRREGRLESRLK